MAKVKIHSKEIPVKTIGRLSQYRRALLICTLKGKTHIFSHEIAAIQHVTAVQVRRDLMLIGFNGSLKQGYNIRDLIKVISEILDYKDRFPIYYKPPKNIPYSISIKKLLEISHNQLIKF